MKRHYLMRILPCILFSFSAFADELAIQPQSQGDVTFVSGGVSGEERALLDATRADYNLSLLFSESSGEYLSDVKVHITDLSGNTVLDAVADGPKLFAKLPSGRYTVNAEVDGKTLSKTVAVKDNHQPAVSFVWR